MTINSNFYIDLLPDGLSWADWSGFVMNISDEQNLPIVGEAEWQLFANELVGTPALANRGLSAPEEFESWQEWAVAMVDAFYGRSVV